MNSTKRCNTNSNVLVAWFLSAIFLFGQCHASSLDVRGKLQLSDPNLRLNSTRVTLTDGSVDGYFSTYSMGTDGSFVFYGVKPGVHLLDVHNLEYHFSHVKIQIPVDEDKEMKCIEYAYPGAPKQPVDCSDGIILTAHAKYNYFESRPTFSILSIFKNPMMLMMLFSGGLMLLMPKLMENMDDEQKEQMKKQMELQKDPTKMMSMLWSDVSGSKADESSKPKRQTGGKKAISK